MLTYQEALIEQKEKCDNKTSTAELLLDFIDFMVKEFDCKS
jgi:hypothetical protein